MASPQRKTATTRANSSTVGGAAQHAQAPLTMPAKFTTQTPQLATERKKRTALAHALDHLRTQIRSTWRQKLLASFSAEAAASGDGGARGEDAREDATALLHAEIESFFDKMLAPAIQERETALVNVMHECFQTELIAKQQLVHAQSQHIDTLLQQQRCHEKDVAHWKSKLDRRIAENNELRKDFYKQLLMLRDLVNKQKNDPKTLKVLDDAIATMSMGKDKAAEFKASGASAAGSHSSASSSKYSNSGGDDSGGGPTSVHREKKKWEERARETMLECQQLQEQVLQLKQQNEQLRSSDFDCWFMNVRSGLAERQRVIDAVYRSKCTWQDVGSAVLEVLNNDLIWDAVEASARQGKERVSRGLEALLAQLDGLDPNGDFAERTDQQGSQGSTDNAPADPNQGRSIYGRRRSSSDPVRLIQCRACNGAGFINLNDGENGTSADSESYLRKTLVQVLELRASLEQANEKSAQLQVDLQVTVAESAVVKEKLKQIEYIRRHGVDSCIQVDLNDEDGIDLDEIMRSVDSHSDSVRELQSAAGNAKKRFTSSRNAQYEHLIVELKSSLNEKDVAINELRRAHKEFQERLLAAQRASQKEQETQLQEVTTLKTSLTLALKMQNSVIEEKQAAVMLVLQKLGKQKSKAQSLSSINSSLDDNDDEEDSDYDGDDDGADLLELDALSEDELEKLDEVKRSEVVARRYSQAIVRVQKEYETQKSLLQQAEEEVGEEDEKRKRTNSISLGNIVVSMNSHPRDLFKALSTAQNELLSIRRASQRASTLQTDRLLTLTTHLGHLSEELCMVRKRTKAEIEFWKLECEKTQNTSKAVASDLQKTQLQLEAANERRVSSSAGDGKCTLCEKHQARLMEISSEILLKDTQNSISESTEASGGDEGTVSNANAWAAQLTQQERQNVSNMVLEIENMYATMTTSKQENARKLIAFALLGEDVVNNSDLRVTGSPISGRRSTRMELSHSSSSSARTFPQQESNSVRRRSRLQSGGQVQDSGDQLRAPNEVSELNHQSRKNSTVADTQNSSLGEDNKSQVGYRRSGSVFRSQGDLENDAQSGGLRRDLLVSGTSLGDNFQPSHRRKKIMRKILSEDEVLRHRYARARMRSEGAVLDVQEAANQDENDVSSQSRPSTEQGKEPAKVLKCSSYLDANGLEVYYEDVEVDDDEEDGDDGENNADQPEEESIGHKHVVRGAVQDGLEYQVAVPLVQVQSEAVQHFPRDIALLNDRNDIENDPQVITQLRDLVKEHTTVKEHLALTNWKILICHLRALRDQNRLDLINHESKRVSCVTSRFNKLQDDQPATEPLHLAVKSTMQKLVEFRESYLDAAIRAREQMRKDSRRVQTHLIHSVSTILTNLSRKNKTRMSINDNEYPHVFVDPEMGNPRKYLAYNNRTLYPAAHVNLSQIPATQQVPTPHFSLPTKSTNQSRQRLIYQSRGRPFSAESRSVTPQEHFSFAQSPSIFEEDNRFPQRAVKFVGSTDGYEFSLTHSLSSITRPKSPITSPTRNPSKSLTLRTHLQYIDQPASSHLLNLHINISFFALGIGSHSASPRKKDPENIHEQPIENFDRQDEDLSLVEHAPSPQRRQPVRPQSSPAKLTPRTFSPRIREMIVAKSPSLIIESDKVPREMDLKETALRIESALIQGILVDWSALAFSAELGNTGWIKYAKKVIAVWEYFQVELHGQCSIERLQQFKLYQDTVSPLRVLCVIVATTLPCLLTVLLTDSVPLQDPFSVNSHSLFWARNLIVSGTLSFSLLMECRFLVTRLKMSVQHVIAMACFLCSSMSLVEFGLSKVIGFPVPFTLVTGGSGWCVLFVACMHFGWDVLIRRNPTVRVELAIYIKVLLVQMSLTVVYPAYTFLFLQLSASVQVFYSVPLLVIKLIAKNVMNWHLNGMDDVRPQEVIFNIEVFHALFISYSMQSSSTTLKTVFIMAIDVVQSRLPLYDVGGIIYELKETETKFEFSTADYGNGFLEKALHILETNPRLTFHPGIRHQAREIQLASPLQASESSRQKGLLQAQSDIAERFSASRQKHKSSVHVGSTKFVPTDDKHGGLSKNLVADAKREAITGSRPTSASVDVTTL